MKAERLEDGTVLIDNNAISQMGEKLEEAGLAGHICFTFLCLVGKDNHIRTAPKDMLKLTKCTLKETLEAIMVLRDNGFLTQCDVSDYMINPDYAYAGEYTEEKRQEFQRFQKAERELIKQWRK